jgi:hypothetical protein
METRRSAHHAMNLKWRLGLKHSVGVDSASQRGGIVLFWHESLEVVLLGMSPRFIDVKIKDVSSNFWYRITFVYGEPRVESRCFMWEMLRRLRQFQIYLGWCWETLMKRCGDLNTSRHTQGWHGKWRTSELC